MLQFTLIVSLLRTSSQNSTICAGAVSAEISPKRGVKVIKSKGTVNKTQKGQKGNHKNACSLGWISLQLSYVKIVIFSFMMLIAKKLKSLFQIIKIDTKHDVLVFTT